jgi:hypothetical protein
MTEETKFYIHITPDGELPNCVHQNNVPGYPNHIPENYTLFDSNNELHMQLCKLSEELGVYLPIDVYNIIVGYTITDVYGPFLIVDIHGENFSPLFVEKIPVKVYELLMTALSYDVTDEDSYDDEIFNFIRENALITMDQGTVGGLGPVKNVFLLYEA